MEKNLKVSVIIAIYNSETFINRCLETVTDQTLKEIEILCINYGSQDRSEELLNKWKRKDDRIVIINQTNQGAGFASNNGLDHARGEFIAFMDVGDLYPDETVLETLYELAKKYNVASAGGSLQIMKEGAKNKGVVGGVDYCFHEEKVIDFHDLQQAFYYQRFIYSTKVLKDNHICFPPYRRFQDVPFFIRAMLACDKIAVTDKYSYLYFQDDTKWNFSEEKTNDLLKGHIETLRLSAKNDLQSLFNWCVKRIEENSTMHHIIENSFKNGNSNIKTLLKEFRQTVNENKVLLDADIRLDYTDLFMNDYIASSDQEVQRIIDNLHMDLSNKKIENDPLVSIILPVYNVEAYVNIAISSIVSQSYRNIELICVNDGSKDNSMQVVNEWANKDKRIIVLEQENQGLSAARNTGMRYAKGKYVQFVDSDDVLPPNSLEYLVGIAETNKADLISFNAKSFYDSYDIAFSNLNYLHYYDRRKGPREVVSGKALFKELLDNDSYRTSVPLLLLNLQFLRDKELIFEKGILHEDNLFTFSVFYLAERACYADILGYLRRVREDSIMTKKPTFRNVYGYFISYLKGRDLLQKDKCPDDAIDSFNEILHRIIGNARSAYMNLDECEREDFINIPGYYKNDFIALISDTLLYREQYMEIREKLMQTYHEKTQINSRLHEAWDQKSEINAKLQRTYKEKSEINAKLQRTYKEKSEINAKLQQAYKDKARRGEMIKALQDELSTIKESRFYKIWYKFKKKKTE